MPLLRPLVLCAALLAAVLAPSPAAAAEAGLSATLKASDPLAPVLVLTNDGPTPCQVAATSKGTLAITEASQGGTAIAALPIEVSYDEGLAILIEEKLVTLDSGASVEVALPVYPIGPTGHALEVVTWSPEAGAFALLYPLQAQGELALAFTYTLPIEVAGPPACVLAATGDAAGGTSKWLIIGAAGLGVLLVLLLLLALVLNRRQRRARRAGTAAAAVLLLAATFGAIWTPGEARATVNVPDSLAGPWADCMAILEANRDITGPILDALNDPDVNVTVVHQPDDDNHEGATDPDNIYIYWDPEYRRDYHGSGGSGTPCDALFHEMHHGYQHNQGTYSRQECGSSGIPTTEVLATRAQNELRERLGLPPRSHYGSKPLPSGDCEDAGDDAERPCTGDGCGDSNGDPHLRTFDGLRYDFQAAGEFVAAVAAAGGSATDGFEVQTRQAPAYQSRVVSVNTAVAMRVGADQVELRLAERQLQLLVNGDLTELAERMELPGGGAIDIVGLEEAARTGKYRQAAVTWPDGSAAVIRAIGSFGLHLSLDLAPERAGKLTGLFGDYDSDPDNDLRVRDGAQLSVPPSFDQLYPEFADSWRVTADSSLFSYEPGAGTETFTDRSFPDARVTIADLPNRAAAEALCRQRGVTDPVILTDCILDVALTGQPDFALAALRGQRVTAPAEYGGSQWTATITNPGDIAQIQFEGVEGDQVFFDIPVTTLPDQCGVFTLRGPENQRLGGGCIHEGAGYIDGLTLPATGEYTLTADPTGDAVGVARIRMIPYSDTQATITAGGPPAPVLIERPGQVAYYTFAATAGQRVFVDVSDATLPSQCGVLALRDPAGHRVGNGCIIGSLGHIDGVDLPASGTYTIGVNPSERRTGQAMLRLIFPDVHAEVLTIDGPAQTINFVQPGAIARLTFTGTAGQRVFVELTEATLPGQCGSLVLHDPAGSRVQTGCILNGQGGFDAAGYVLARTGTYTLILDPTSRTTGAATIRVRL